MKYWVVCVGDDPEDEVCQGPFENVFDAIMEAKKDTYHTSRDARLYKDMIGWHGQISCLYVISSEGKPTYFEFIQPRLRGRV